MLVSEVNYNLWLLVINFLM